MQTAIDNTVTAAEAADPPARPSRPARRPARRPGPAGPTGRGPTTTTATEPPGHRPLLVTADEDLLDELLRLATAACGEVDVAPDATAARRHWPTAPLVVVGADAAAGCARARLPCRRDVVLVASIDTAAPGDPADWQVAAELGADHVVVLPAAAPWLTERFSTAGTGPPGTARIVGVVGGRGGAGASVLATALAVTAVRAGHRVMLVDADPLGGGLDLTLGWEAADGYRWPELAGSRGRVSVPELYRALPHRGALVVVSWDRGDPLELVPAAMDATLDAGRRGSDLVVVDLPRYPDDAAIRAVQLADPVLLVVPADVRACASAARVAARIAAHCRSVRVVVRGPAPGGLGSREVARALGFPLAGSLRPEPGLAAALERSEPPAASGRGPLATLSTRLLADLLADRPTDHPADRPSTRPAPDRADRADRPTSRPADRADVTYGPATRSAGRADPAFGSAHPFADDAPDDPAATARTPVPEQDDPS